MARTVKPRPIPADWATLLRLIPRYDPIATAGTALFVETVDEVKAWAKHYGGPQREVFCFVEELAGRALDFFPECLKHVKGELAGQPFALAEWQGAVLANIFGWVRLDGSRRYREVFFFVPRKNGKTALAAGIVLFVLFCDGEHGAEIYSAAADKDQATLVFDHAKGMVLQEPELESRSKVYETYKSIVMPSLSSVYKVVSAAASTKHGFNSHLVVIDELHAQPNPELVDVLMTSTGARRQPLILHTTTSDFERPSVCNEKHDYASKVRDGVIQDPSFLPIIYEANEKPHTVAFQSLHALEQLDKMCTCQLVQPIQIAQCWHEAYAAHAMTSGDGRTGKITGSDAASTKTGPSAPKGYAPRAMSSPSSTPTPTTNDARSASGQNGPQEPAPGQSRT